MTEQEFLTAIGVRVRVARAARGLTQREVAEGAGIHRTVVGRIESGRVNFGVDCLRRLARALDTTTTVLIPSGRCGSVDEDAVGLDAVVLGDPDSGGGAVRGG
jgi:transcriptional regulator with XRE-family HTH domain